MNVQKKPVIDESLCIGCGTCPAMCPKAFGMRDSDGIAFVKDTIAESNNDIQDAIEACPTEAIAWEE